MSQRTGQSTQIMMDQEFDAAFVADMQELRAIRFGLLQKMLQNPAEIASELIRRGLISESEFDTKSLVALLESQIGKMEDRTQNPTAIHVDDLRLYVDLVAEKKSDI